LQLSRPRPASHQCCDPAPSRHHAPVLTHLTTPHRRLHRHEPDQEERFANAWLSQNPQRALICQIDADELQLGEAIELVPAGSEAEFHVTVEDQGRLRLERIVLTPEAEA